MVSANKLRTALKKHGHKTTRARELVYVALTESDRPLTNSELFKRLESVDKVSVYRNLALFEKIGVAHRIWNGFRSKVELSDSYSPHHHHFTCNKCGVILSFKDEKLEHALTSMSAELGVVVTGHVVELNGTCRTCGNLNL